ncbi:MAG: hypothetical protein IH956_00570 [Chloroflexi bacterium]|nr:hypothetical protein [Chloroflexota bacterium]
MSEENKNRREKMVEDVETLVDEVNKAVRVVVVRGSEAAESVGENVRDTIKQTLKGVRAARDSVVMVRVNKESLEKMDELVEAGIVNSRSEAAAFLIAEGIKARQGLFDKISSKIDEIREAKEELRKLLDEEDPPPA